MNYPEELRERYNEVMYDERDIIEKFLKEQYDIRYGRQRDTWHFEPAVKMMNIYGNEILVTDVMLDKDVFVKFIGTFCNKQDEYECFHFAYGELSNVIEALPDVNQILIKNAVSDIACLCRECSVNIEESPFNTNINGKSVSVALVDYIDGRVIAYNHEGKVVSDEYTSDFFVGLRDHINIEVLHRYNEYNKLVKFLSEQPNLRFEPANWGDVEFTIHGTDVKVDVLSASLDSNGKLQLSVDDDNRETIYLEEKDIRPEYLVDLVGYIEDHCRCDIMDTYNGHNEELVRKINAAWRDPKYHNKFSEILLALLVRDHEEYIDKYCEIEDYSGDWAMEHAHEIMEGVCDDWDLETILSFIRYKE